MIVADAPIEKYRGSNDIQEGEKPEATIARARSNPQEGARGFGPHAEGILARHERPWDRRRNRCLTTARLRHRAGSVTALS